MPSMSKSTRPVRSIQESGCLAADAVLSDVTDWIISYKAYCCSKVLYRLPGIAQLSKAAMQLAYMLSLQCYPALESGATGQQARHRRNDSVEAAQQRCSHMTMEG